MKSRLTWQFFALLFCLPLLSLPSSQAMFQGNSRTNSELSANSLQQHTSQQETPRETSKEEKLLFAVDLVRHGDRTPIIEIPKDPHSWGLPLGELTPKGIEQEVLLGQALRQEWIKNHGLLPPHYEPGTLFVRSTGLNRTQASAKALLKGLYPETPEIPVAVVPKEEDNLLLVKPSSNPFSMASRYLKERKQWNQRISPLGAKLEKWSTLTGLSLNNEASLINLGDNLAIRKLHGVPLPAGIDTKTADEVLDILEQLLVHKFKMPEVTDNMGSEFLSTVLRFFKGATRPEAKLKYVLYLGHDSTILSVLNKMEVGFDHLPGYASRLGFTLFETKAGLQIRVRYDGKPIFIPRCNGSDCTFAQFFNELL